MNAAPVIAVAFALLSVIVSTEGAFGATSDGAKLFATVGCCSTVSAPEAPATVPAFAEEMLPVLLG